MTSRRIPLHCIVPPHLIRKLAESKDPAIRARAMQALALSARIRGRRDILSAITLPALGGHQLHRTI
jgi:hypothetical protein